MPPLSLTSSPKRRRPCQLTGRHRDYTAVTRLRIWRRGFQVVVSGWANAITKEEVSTGEGGSSRDRGLEYRSRGQRDAIAGRRQ